MKRIFTLLLLLNLTGVFAQHFHHLPEADNLFKNTGEIYFALPGAAAEANQLTKIIGIDRIKGDTVFAYASQKEYQKLQSQGNGEFILLPHPSELIKVEMSDNPRQVLDWNYYPTYPAYEQIMADFAAQYPDLCQLYTIGTLASGRKLLAVRISDNVGAEEDEPEFLYSATIHGDETTGYIMMLHLIDHLLTNYNQDPRITSMVNNIDLWIAPLANPDGTYYGGNNTVNGARRYNANNVDLNRNYPDPADGPHPDGNAWQPETVHFMNFAESRNFVMGANFHGGIELVNYPWDTWSRLTADNNWWYMVSRAYADTAQAYGPPGYFDDEDNGITNGYAWYRITGGRQDYMNYFHQCREVTLEISNTKLVPASQLLNFWEYNHRSILNYLEEVTYGVRGIVTDTITGAPLRAQVFISNHDKDSSMVFSSLPVGNYHRLLKAGTYNLTFIADGYLPKTYRNVVVTDKNVVRLDARLWNGSAIPGFSASATQITAGSQVQFFDASGGNPTYRLWTFEGGNITTSTELNPVVTFNDPGTFDVSLFAQNAIGGNTLLREDYITVSSDYFIGGDGATTCNARFFDSNGSSGNYQNNENLTTTFYSADPTKAIRVHFNSFNIEVSDNCAKDALYIYDGPDDSYPLIGKYCGHEIPADVLTSTGGGAVTFVFVSDDNITAEGWEAILSCDSGVGVSLKPASSALKVYPNPANNEGFVIESPEILQSIQVIDLSGRVIYSVKANKNSIFVPTHGWKNSVYQLKAVTADGILFTKVSILN